MNIYINEMQYLYLKQIHQQQKIYLGTAANQFNQYGKGLHDGLELIFSIIENREPELSKTEGECLN